MKESRVVIDELNDIEDSSKELIFDKFKNKVFDTTGIRPVILSEQVGERHYFTDYFEIHLGKGLDFFDFGRFKVKKKRITIEITLKNDSSNFIPD